ncbi:Dabb family protein [Autumnicola psychrophila]|uniref:Dabb family protein n=1 Tax=Autumnicola psychrophila TaxID=3075592 RepID=A0ABU3DVA8_9FLAO|nr:Dabb family protein [Zunongwangia sp. F225]MDT0687630.1 Dabb family protein [Zunongwangia sp. F225]
MSKILKTLVIATVVLGANNLSAQEEKMEFDSNFTHVVYFWFHNPDSAEDRQAFETSVKKFMKNSEYAQTKFIGVPAGTPRDVVDNSYTYSLILSFPSKEIQNKYQTEPAHEVFIEESSHLWKKVQVYDSVGIDKLAEK